MVVLNRGSFNAQLCRISAEPFLYLTSLRCTTLDLFASHKYTKRACQTPLTADTVLTLLEKASINEQDPCTNFGGEKMCLMLRQRSD